MDRKGESSWLVGIYRKLYHTVSLGMVKSHTGIMGIDRGCVEMSERERECRYAGKDGKKGVGA